MAGVTPERAPLDIDTFLPVHQRRFGDHEFFDAPLSSLILLSQIRDKTNPVSNELKESIDTTGLRHQPDVARLNEDQLGAWVAYTNWAWEKNVSLDELAEYKLPTGLFNLVVAGHSRAAQMQALAYDHSLATRQATDWVVVSRNVPDTSVGGLLRTQSQENIHSSVPLERGAMSNVELYRFGLMAGLWTDGASFASSKDGQRLSRRQLKDTMAFVELPKDVGYLALTGRIKYLAGIELGNAVPIIRDAFASEMGLTGTDDLGPEIDEAIELKLRGVAAHLFNHKLNAPASRLYIDSMVDKLRKDTADRRGETKSKKVIEDPLFTLISSGRQAYEIRRREEMLCAQRLKEVSSGPMEAATDVLLALSGSAKSEAIDHVVKDSEEAHGKLAKSLGRSVALELVEELGPETLDLFAESAAEAVS
jgi:hypothetical protein